MKLTDKCKKDFEKWFLNESEYERSLLTKESKKLIEGQLLNAFYFMSISAKYGVYVDFFDSMEIYISDIVDCYYTKSKLFINSFIICIEVNKDYTKIDKNTRHEARTEAIKKVNEIYNDRI